MRRRGDRSAWYFPHATSVFTPFISFFSGTGQKSEKKTCVQRIGWTLWDSSLNHERLRRRLQPAGEARIGLWPRGGCAGSFAGKRLHQHVGTVVRSASCSFASSVARKIMQFDKEGMQCVVRLADELEQRIARKKSHLLHPFTQAIQKSHGWLKNEVELLGLPSLDRPTSIFTSQFHAGWR
jgi:hypothetical protein